MKRAKNASKAAVSAATASALAPARLSDAAVESILLAAHDNPFSALGVQETDNGFVARCLIPHATEVSVIDMDGAWLGDLARRDGRGFFEGPVNLKVRQVIRYRARNSGGEWTLTDPFSFGPVLGPMDDYYMGEGSHLRLFDKLGAHIIHHEGSDGVHFAVWAPNAKRVSVVGDFNDWDGRRHPMRFRQDSGIWEIFIPDVGEGRAYKFEIVGYRGDILPLKSDPFAFHAELRPATASIVTRKMDRQWGDAGHREFWSTAKAHREPISIYEVHAGSWRMKPDGSFLTWDELAEQLIPYVVETGFTHIEFMPIAEYPYDPSWGYQATGLYAPTSRFGDAEGFARFVDGAHQAGIGVLIDWVPAHFPRDSFGLARFDGTALYEHEDPRKGFQPDWNTYIYNFGRPEVVSFLVNNALYWAEKYHVDGLRVDAVASMLHLDYSRKEGEWIPNEKGGNENLEAVGFLQRMNTEVYGHIPGFVTMAEDSTDWPGVTHAADKGGLGFGFKWNMGFMHDTLRYLKREPIHRKHHHQDLTFGLMYAFNENYVLPLSHDEVVHGKSSLIHKMPGDDWQKFANLRAYFAFMWAYPGKKLLFMGQEFAQRREWSEERQLDWDMLQHAPHRGVRSEIQDLNGLYRSKPALHARDCEPEGFEWLVVDDAERSVFAWLRKAPGEKPIAVVSNFTPVVREAYELPLPGAGQWQVIFNSDAVAYGGSGAGNSWHINALKADVQRGKAVGNVTLPPLATIYLEPFNDLDVEEATETPKRVGKTRISKPTKRSEGKTAASNQFGSGRSPS